MKTQDAMTICNKPLTTPEGIPDAEIYQRPMLTVRGYNGKRGTKHSCLSSLANTRIVRAAFPDYKRVDHARRAIELRALSYKTAKAWGNLWESAYVARYGRVPMAWDYRISSIGDDGLAEYDKAELRRLAILKGQAASLAHLHEQAAGVMAMRAVGKVRA